MSVTVDTSAFQAALRKHLASTSRELSEVVNMHAAAVLMRAFLSLDPKDPQAARSDVRQELMREVEERTRLVASGKRAGQRIRVGKSRQFQARHRILQWLRARAGNPGLQGQQMRTEVGRFSGRRIASVGSVKSLLVKMLRKIMPAFTQFGTVTKKSGGRQVAGNAMLIRLAGQYGHTASNVGVARTARASGTPASPGWSPTASAEGSLGVKSSQEGRVNPMYSAAIARGIADETAEMLRHLEAKVLDNAEASGFTVT